MELASWWGIFVWWTATVTGVTGFIWRINSKAESNCKAIVEMRKEMRMIKQMLAPQDPHFRFVMVGQCEQTREHCKADRISMVTEIKHDLARNNVDMDRHFEAIYAELREMHKSLTRFATQLEERTDRRGS